MGIGDWPNRALAKQGIGQTGHWALAKQVIGHWPNRALGKQGIGQTGHWALVISHVLRASPLANVTVNSQQPTANYQLPTTNCQLPTANYQLPTTNYQLPTTNYQLPTTNSQLPTTNYQLQNCQLSTAFLSTEGRIFSRKFLITVRPRSQA